MTDPKFKIRSMEPNEVNRVAKLVRDLQHLQKLQNIQRLPSDEDMAFDLTCKDEETGELRANKYGTFTMVAVDTTRLDDDDQAYIVGYMIYSLTFSLIHGKYIFLNSFFIEEDYRRHKLGSKMMEYLRLHAKAAGITFLDVGVMNDNKIGHKFYSSYGYYPVSEEYQIIRKSLD